MWWLFFPLIGLLCTCMVGAWLFESLRFKALQDRATRLQQRVRRGRAPLLMARDMDFIARWHAHHLSEFDALMLFFGQLSRIDRRKFEEHCLIARSFSRNFYDQTLLITRFSESYRDPYTLSLSLHYILSVFSQAAPEKLENFWCLLRELIQKLLYYDHTLNHDQQHLIQTDFLPFARILGEKSPWLDDLQRLCFTSSARTDHGHTQYERHHQYTHSNTPLGRPFKANIYDKLEVPFNATDAEVKRSYRRLMMKYHPDKWNSKALSREEFKKVEARAQQVQRAFLDWKTHFSSKKSSG